MVWIGLHGVMFLFLFSDFYKTKYTNAAPKPKQSTKLNGYIKLKPGNGHVYHTNGKSEYMLNSEEALANSNNKGACMPVLDDDVDITDNNKHLAMANGNANGIYKNGYANGHTLKEGVLSSNDAILNPDSNSSSLHQRKVK